MEELFEHVEELTLEGASIPIAATTGVAPATARRGSRRGSGLVCSPMQYGLMLEDK